MISRIWSCVAGAASDTASFTGRWENQPFQAYFSVTQAQCYRYLSMCYTTLLQSKGFSSLVSGRSGLVLMIVLTVLFGQPRVFAQDTRQFEGVIYPVEERELALPVDGLIDEVVVVEGAYVEKGHTLLRLRSQSAKMEAQRRRVVWQDNTGLDTSIERLKIISDQYQTLTKLFETTGTVSKDELNALLLEKIQAKGQRDNSIVQKSLAEFEYRLSDQQLKERSLKAPIDGLVTKIEKFDGEWVSAGETVASMVDLSEVVLRTSVPDPLARLLEKNAEVTANIDGFGQASGVVTFISPVADPASGLVRIRIKIANPEGLIRPGTRGEVLL